MHFAEGPCQDDGCDSAIHLRCYIEDGESAARRDASKRSKSFFASRGDWASRPSRSYRDGCKAVQPLALGGQEAAYTLQPVRRRLPVDCRSVRHKFDVGGQKGYLHIGFYDDGSVGEIFIRMAKEGSTISGLMDTIATLTSIAVQYGVPLEALVNKFIHVRFEPSGFTTNPDIPIAKSLTDYIFRYLGLRFLDRQQQEAAGLLSLNGHAPGAPEQLNPVPRHAGNPKPAQIKGHAFNPQSDAPACQDCGAIMIRNGSCYKCLNCGGTTGCS